MFKEIVIVIIGAMLMCSATVFAKNNGERTESLAFFVLI